MTPIDYINDNFDRIKEDYKELLAIPSISTDPAYAHDVLRAANWLAAKMREIGLMPELIAMPEGRHPVVMGTWDGAGPDAKTVLIYCHYDVQPASIEDGWHTEPFTPTEVGDRIYARGATDSKIHVMANLSAVEALLANGSCPVNIKLVFEGEEESGGETISALVDQQPERMRADICVISDGSILAPEQPSIIYGLRGIVTMELHIDGPQADLHSGHWGGAVHNPAQALAEIITKLHNDDGSVAVPGFYDDVRALDDSEREAMRANTDWLAEEYGTLVNPPAEWGEPGYSIHERTGARPTLEINGISGGYTGAGFKTVLPSHAMAKISCRLVPDQDPEDIIRKVSGYIAQLTPPTVRSRITDLDYGRPALLLAREGSAIQAAAAAYETAWGNPVIFERAGGSVPIAYDLEKISQDMALLSFSYKGGGAHSINEHALVPMLYKGIVTAITFLQAIAE